MPSRPRGSLTSPFSPPPPHKNTSGLGVKLVIVVGARMQINEAVRAAGGQRRWGGVGRRGRVPPPASAAVPAVSAQCACQAGATLRHASCPRPQGARLRLQCDGPPLRARTLPPSSPGAGREPCYASGSRVTDPETLRAAVQAAGRARMEVEARLSRVSARGRGAAAHGGRGRGRARQPRNCRWGWRQGRRADDGATPGAGPRGEHDPQALARRRGLPLRASAAGGWAVAARACLACLGSPSDSCPPILQAFSSPPICPAQPDPCSASLSPPTPSHTHTTTTHTHTHTCTHAHTHTHARARRPWLPTTWPRGARAWWAAWTTS